MPNTHNTPFYTCFSSYNSHPNQYQSSKGKRTPKQRTASPNHSLKLRGFAQARRARSGEPPLRLGEGSMKHPGNIMGSRLGGTPLAWARCSLAQEAELVAWVTFRAKVLSELPVSSRLGETDSLGEDPYYVTTSTTAPRMHYRAAVRVEQNQTGVVSQDSYNRSRKGYKMELARTRKSLTWWMQPYLESLPSYTDGAPPWTPTNRGHGITSRPLKHSPGGLT
ncbi:hypothetical protein DEO72_LG6g1949 [Vigna unguiculata]|uniref:Uncharacterized protein n=1 Tax=Vigna unguiculata TaxID=3917 RepID=A0A4D6M787_VIGUN|nr:hypothetical protein DEO72_LG6g1949 [Vigna unguiculata]